MMTAYSKKITLAGLFLALGIILPFATAHGFGLSGNILLPMHIPVLLCGFYCGPLMGLLCGLLLPFLNSLLTGMPAMFPMALIMTFELATYGFVSGLCYHLVNESKKYVVICAVLVLAMIAGRLIYGVVCYLLLLSGTTLKNISLIGAIVTGLPGIFTHLILVPVIVHRIQPEISPANVAKNKAVDLVKSGEATCALVRGNKIVRADSPRGIVYLIDLYEQGLLKDAFVADKIIGKAAAMIFTLGGVKGCFGANVSDSAVLWLKQHKIPLSYGNRSEYIVNRKGDGLCPMEETVKDISDAQEGLFVLKQKILSHEITNKQRKNKKNAKIS